MNAPSTVTGIKSDFVRNDSKYASYRSWTYNPQVNSVYT